MKVQWETLKVWNRMIRGNSRESIRREGREKARKERDRRRYRERWC